jgi:hypothetical protein
MSAEQSVSADIPPAMQVMQLLWPGAIVVQAVHVAAKLRIADRVASGPKTADELARSSGVHARSLQRLLRALTSVGMFEEDGDGRFRQSALSDTLRSDHPHSIRPFAMMLGAGFVWKAAGELGAAIESGQPAFDRVNGVQFFDYLAAHRDDAAIFNAAMSSMPAYLTAIAEAYDFSKFERLVDVGGGHGATLIAILTKHQKLRGVLHDLPAVVETVPAPPASVADRLEIAASSFFESVPPDADAYLLKGVIHDWNDDAALAILKTCRRAMRPDSRLLIVEQLLAPSSDPGQTMMDVLMIMLTGGRERSEADFRSLLDAAALSLTTVTPTMGPSILESRPI